MHLGSTWARNFRSILCLFVFIPLDIHVLEISNRGELKIYFIRYCFLKKNLMKQIDPYMANSDEFGIR